MSGSNFQTDWDLSHLRWAVGAFIGVESFELGADGRVLLQCVEHPAGFVLGIA